MVERKLQKLIIINNKMGKSRFAQPVSMVCNKEQFEKYLKKPMEELGYNTANCKFREGEDIIVSNFVGSRSNACSIGGVCKNANGRHFIDHFNPELFLAIAGMREGNDIHKGEYFMCIQDVVMDFSEEVAYKKGVIYKSESDGCITDEGGDKNHDWVKVSYTDEYFRKATLQDLIEKFGKKEEETDGNCQMNSLRYAVQNISKSDKTNAVENSMLKAELPKHLNLANIILYYCDNDFVRVHELYYEVGKELESRLKAEKKQLTEKKSQLNKISFTHDEGKTVEKNNRNRKATQR